jgi:hypothetical protein
MTNAVELKVHSGIKEIHLSLKSASQQDRTHVINFVAGLFDLNTNFVPTKVDLSISKIPVHGISGKDIPSNAPRVIPDRNRQRDIEIEKDFKPSVTRKLPMIDSNRSEIVSVGEKFQAALNKKEGEPEFYKTGIKVDDDGTKRYKCRYNCHCGAKGNHYIPLKTVEVNCHECGQPLKVALATGEVDASRVPVRDSFGNYYIAE